MKPLGSSSTSYRVTISNQTEMDVVGHRLEILSKSPTPCPLYPPSRVNKVDSPSTMHTTSKDSSRCRRNSKPYVVFTWICREVTQVVLRHISLKIIKLAALRYFQLKPRSTSIKWKKISQPGPRSIPNSVVLMNPWKTTKVSELRVLSVSKAEAVISRSGRHIIKKCNAEATNRVAKTRN